MNKQVKKTLIILIITLAIMLFVYYLNKPQSPEEKRNVEAISLEQKYSVVKEDTIYYNGIKGHLAKPESPGNYPGVIMIHEWWGLNENIKEMADKLASQGYIVLAVDLYEGQATENSTKARELSSSVRENPDKAIANMIAAVSYLKEEQKADKIASLGWCFGGGQSLQIVLDSGDLDAAVIYYGNLVTDEARLSKIDDPILGIFGSEDTSIPVETVNAFDESLDNLGIENEIYIYEGVGHAFANPSGMNYAPEETEDAWIKTLSFLERHLKN